VTRARILKGDWEARSMRGVIKREWFEIVDVLPADLTMIRYWDTAYQKKKTADYTVGVKYGIGSNGVGFIVHVARAKASPHEVEGFIANTASQDSRNSRVVLQQEPGSGSALWIDSMSRGALLGYPVCADQVKGTKFRALATVPRRRRGGQHQTPAQHLERGIPRGMRAVQRGRTRI
jgi:phage terminase large subunit-like protein